MRDTDGERRSLSRGEWAAVVLAVVVVAAAAWMWLRKPASPPAAVQPTADTTDSQQEQPVPAVAQETPPAAVSDEQARTQLEALSSDPAFRRWLAAADDIVRRWATATDNIAEGVSPRKVLGLIGPKAPFRAVRRGGKDYLSPESCARYDEFARAVSSIDAQAFVGVYRSLKPAIEYAYRALGYPNGSLDAVTSRALRRILDAPAVDGQVELVPDRGVYVFADPKLEGLTQVDKHLLRMGPRNTRLVQAKARQLREALAFPAEAASAK